MHSGITEALNSLAHMFIGRREDQNLGRHPSLRRPSQRMKSLLSLGQTTQIMNPEGNQEGLENWGIGNRGNDQIGKLIQPTFFSWTCLELKGESLLLRIFSQLYLGVFSYKFYLFDTILMFAAACEGKTIVLLVLAMVGTAHPASWGRSCTLFHTWSAGSDLKSLNPVFY